MILGIEAQTPGHAYDVRVSGGLAYVADSITELENLFRNDAADRDVRSRLVDAYVASGKQAKQRLFWRKL